MSRLLRLAALALTLSAPAAGQGQVPFSATLITTSKHNPPETMTMKVYSSGRKFRMESDKTTVVTDLTRGKSYNLVPAQKLAIEIPFPADFRQSWSAPGSPCAARKGSTCKDLGAEKVGGRQAHKWQITPEKGTATTLWLDARTRFPLKSESADSSSELRDLKEGPQPEALFAVPKDFKISTAAGLRDVLDSARPAPSDK